LYTVNETFLLTKTYGQKLSCFIFFFNFQACEYSYTPTNLTSPTTSSTSIFVTWNESHNVDHNLDKTNRGNDGNDGSKTYQTKVRILC